MIDHLGLQAADVNAATAFYLEVFAPLGMQEALRFPHPEGAVVGLAGPDGTPDFWLSPPTGDETREVHVAFAAASRDVVDAVHDAAIKAGAQILHAPREWPEYHPGYYAVFVRDLDGHNVEAVHHG